MSSKLSSVGSLANQSCIFSEASANSSRFEEHKEVRKQRDSQLLSKMQQQLLTQHQDPGQTIKNKEVSQRMPKIPTNQERYKIKLITTLYFPYIFPFPLAHHIYPHFLQKAPFIYDNFQQYRVSKQLYKFDQEYKMIDYPQQDTYPIQRVQFLILLARRIQLAIGSLLLLFIVVRILYKKLYVYNTTKMFMWCCICYLIGMSIVLSYTDKIANNHRFIYSKKQDNHMDIIGLLSEMGSKLRICCGSIGFINLYAYDLGYFFAVLVTYNVHCVIKGNYRQFMRNVCKNKIVIPFMLLMLTLHLLPFIFNFIGNFQQDRFLYSYGPTGIKWYDGENKISLLLYCGVVYMANHPVSSAFGIANIYLCPFIMLIAHFILLKQNRSKIKLIQKQEYLNSKQQFIINSGNISLVVFGIQLFNFCKVIMSFFESHSWDWVMLIINFLFDFYPFLLFVYYLKYTKEKRGLLHGASTILDQSIQD